jgi:hypothetical protein
MATQLAFNILSEMTPGPIDWLAPAFLMVSLAIFTGWAIWNIPFSIRVGFSKYSALQDKVEELTLNLDTKAQKKD